MRTETQTDDTWLWVAAIAGPLAWLSDLAASWWVQIAGRGTTDLHMLHVMTAGALALAIAAAGIAIQRLRRLYGEGDRTPQRAWFLAQSSLALSVMSILLLIGTALREMP